jgi:hypothetical protein
VNKVTRSVLKEIVKECMVEIFTETFVPGNVDNSLMQENLNRSQESNNSNRPIPQRPRSSNTNTTGINSRPGLDSISYNQNSDEQVNESYERNIDNITNSLTKDPIMAEIFKDTASSTLQQQMSADSNRGPSVLTGGDKASLHMHNSDPTELFAESAGKWATLAFANPPIKR